MVQRNGRSITIIGVATLVCGQPLDTPVPPSGGYTANLAWTQIDSHIIWSDGVQLSWFHALIPHVVKYLATRVTHVTTKRPAARRRFSNLKQWIGVNCGELRFFQSFWHVLWYARKYSTMNKTDQYDACLKTLHFDWLTWDQGATVNCVCFSQKPNTT